MNNEELIKKVLELEKKVLELSKKDTLNMFGSTHDTVGSTTSDLVLKTRGKIRILWSNKFIDLIKDGKLNVNTDIVFSVADKDSIGSKTGIYITENGEVYLKYKSLDAIPIAGEIGTTYVSFLAPLETSSENKYTALTNIGFLYPDTDSIKEDSLKNGIIYVESNLKLYTVKDGTISEYTFKFPNPFTELFIIAKNDSDKGALVIVGKGDTNSISFDSLIIYNTDSSSIIDSKLPIKLSISNTDKVVIDNVNTTIKNTLQSNYIKSENANSNFGFQLYMINGKSILEVDKLVVRDLEDNGLSIYPEYFFLLNNVVQQSDEGILTLYYEHNYKVGDTLRAYIKQEKVYINSDDEEESTTKLEPKDIKVLSVIDSHKIETDLDEEDISNLFIFLIDYNPLRLKSNNLDILNDGEVNSRYGNIEELNLLRSDFTDITGTGVYSKVGAFEEALYVKEYNLDDEDKTSRFASTEWIRKLINNILPIGTIILFSGTTIPDGWAICDGTNGTPNLIGKFIKADTTAGNTGGSNSASIGVPKHNHTFIITPNNGKLFVTVDLRADGKLPYKVFDEGGSTWFGLFMFKNDTDTPNYAPQPNVVGTTLDAGEDGADIDLQPEYYTLIFIMKIKDI